MARASPLTGDSPPDVEARLRELSNRVRGARAIGIRREPIPAAYRVFFRQVGLDPDRAAHADRGGGARADAARRLPDRGHARRHPADLADRHRRAGVGARLRAPSTGRSGSARASTASSSDAPATRRCCHTGGWSSPTPAGRWRCCSASARPATSRAREPAASRSTRSWFPACRRSTRKRRSGRARARCSRRRTGVRAQTPLVASGVPGGTQEERSWFSAASQ